MTENRQLQQAELDVVARARLRLCGGPREFCIAPLLALPPDVLVAAIENVVVRGVRRLVDGGWRPVDIGEMRARRLDAVVAICLFDTLALVTAMDARLRSDPLWTAELDEVAPDRWQVPTRSVLAQRAAAERWSSATFAGIAVDLLADIAEWPTLAAATPVEARGGDGETAMLIKVRALLAKAERTEFEHEAEAFTAKAQELTARYSIDDAMLGAGGSTSSAGAALQRMWIAAPYVNAKAAIIGAVAVANRCRALLSHGIGCVSIVGMSTDVRSTVLLATSLQLQAARAAAQARPDDRQAWGAGVRSFRRSFLLAFGNRIGERLRTAGAEAERAVDPDRLLPVLADRQDTVDRAVAEWFPRTTQLRSSPVDPSGWAAGTAAADLAHLDTHTPLRGTA